MHALCAESDLGWAGLRRDEMEEHGIDGIESARADTALQQHRKAPAALYQFVQCQPCYTGK